MPEEPHLADPDTLRDGSYYKDARLWYAARYLHPYVERTLFALASAVVIVAIIVSVVNFYLLFPTSVKTPIVVDAKDLATQYSVMKPIGGKNEDANVAVARHLVTQYIVRRESYDPDRLEEQTGFIKNASSRQIFLDFQQQMSIQNPASPILQFQNHTVRDIQLTSLVLRRNGSRLPNEAVAQFRATIAPKGSGGKSGSVSLWEAQLAFSLPNAVLVAKTDLPFEFIVSDYQVKPLN